MDLENRKVKMITLNHLMKVQRIMQWPGEHWMALHERLRSTALKSFRIVRTPTRLITPSWYTYDASKILRDIPNAVAVCTSTCKHEMPYEIIVGRRNEGWMRLEGSDRFAYLLSNLGRELTPEEKNRIYDAM